MSELERARQAYAGRAWRAAYEAYVEADRAEPIPPEDLQRVAVAAYLLGRDDEGTAFLERAHRAYDEDGNVLGAVRCAFWIGMLLVAAGETAPGAGWIARAQRQLAGVGRECVEHGYLLLPLAFQQQARGDLAAAAQTAASAVELAQRYGDADLLALAAHMQGHVLVVAGQVAEGMRLLDEAMVAATAGAESPIVAGIVYCGVILACVETYEVRRAQEWTEVLTRWCEAQPQLVAFRGRCLVHRAEIMQLRGDWSAALDEARRAGEWLTRGVNRPATAQAFYRQGEVHRLRGELAEAERAYRAASRHGFEPQPGLALLRLAQGRTEVAAAAIRRVLTEQTARTVRAGLLPAYAEIMLAAADLDAAREACGELEQLSEAYGSALLAASSAYARGALELAAGDTQRAVSCLRRASQGFQALEAPYEAARARVLLGLACRALGDEDGAALEIDGARDAFARLGAAVDAARARSLLAGPETETHGLSGRELEVLQLVAAGRSNREIAGALVISEHTVARHLQNIFAKLDVASRTAAAAFAYEHGLV